MSKLIIWIGGKPLLNGYRIRDFHWKAEHGCYVYEGKEFADTEFNAKFDKAYRNHIDLQPKVRVVGIGIAPAPVATITQSREVSLEEAEAVMARLAPDRLKRKTGRPQMLEVA